MTSQKNKFGKLWDLVPISSKASLEKGPCQKLTLNCNSQPKYKGWKFDTAPYKSLNFELVPNWRNQNKFWTVCVGRYQTLIPYISIANCNSELIFGMRVSLRILYKNMTSYPIISKNIFVTSSLRYSVPCTKQSNLYLHSSSISKRGIVPYTVLQCLVMTEDFLTVWCTTCFS